MEKPKKSPAINFLDGINSENLIPETPTLPENPREARAALIKNAKELINQARKIDPTPEELRMERAGKAWDTCGPTGKAGRPRGSKALAAFIENETSGFTELAIHALKVMRGEIKVAKRDVFGNVMFEDPPLSAQAEARQWLADRGLGKAPVSIEVAMEGKVALDLEALSSDEARQYLQLARKMRSALPSGPAQPVVDGVVLSAGVLDAVSADNSGDS